MKYQLVEWVNGFRTIYEVTDDYTMERMIWSREVMVQGDWKTYIKISNSFAKVKWISKEEAFTIIL